MKWQFGRRIVINMDTNYNSMLFKHLTLFYNFFSVGHTATGHIKASVIVASSIVAISSFGIFKCLLFVILRIPFLT